MEIGKSMSNISNNWFKLTQPSASQLNQMLD